MDFAITLSAHDVGWEVVGLREQGGGEVAVPLASFGHRKHAEAFLADLVGMVDGFTDGDAGPHG